jgi:hypothetical protein
VINNTRNDTLPLRASDIEQIDEEIQNSKEKTILVMKIIQKRLKSGSPYFTCKALKMLDYLLDEASMDEANAGHFGESPCIEIIYNLLHPSFGILNDGELNRVLKKQAVPFQGNIQRKVTKILRGMEELRTNKVGNSQGFCIIQKRKDTDFLHD